MYERHWLEQIPSMLPPQVEGSAPEYRMPSIQA